MWVERILRNVGDTLPPEWANRTVDYLDITWDECKRILKKRSRSGQWVHILLPPGQRLTHGDVLAEDPPLVIHVLPAPVLVARPATPALAARLALELGNLHLPTQITDTHLLFPDDPQARKALSKLEISFEEQLAPFEPTALLVTPNVQVSKNFQVLRASSTSNP